jgi:DNA-binding XRE family transcriptional regulator
MPEIENHLGTLRQKRGISAAQLARTVGVTRQTIYAMEAGSYVPNTAVALRLAQALEVKVEDLFTLPQAEPTGLRSEEVTLLPGSEALHPGQPVQLCRVNKRLVASPPSPVPWYFPVSDAVVVSPSAPAPTFKSSMPPTIFAIEFLSRGATPEFPSWLTTCNPAA